MHATLLGNRRVQTAAHAGLENGHVHVGLGKCLHRRGGEHLEIGRSVIHRPDPRGETVEDLAKTVLGDIMPVDPDPLGG